ncbi:hypothetical protein [Fusibacter tunisiensis]|jgi:predicted nucleic acid-binding protein|uniref:Nucleic acid-binding protein n=1 Tax=Fusibacter tunisiensis TaxID=1008308 RepID=A0ABS2MRA8_9FIRM|nr:hypothetical protein [Fusibacter tunisiensis]MBM7561929.1 putative nucleic acid-binding protein [Fusibacter tunisiensis]
MKNHSRYLNSITKAYANAFKTHGVSNHVKESINVYRAEDVMRRGYEIMAQINLDFCEFGLVDCLSSIDLAEKKLNGDDN